MRGRIFFVFTFISILSFGQDQVKWEFQAENEVFIAKATIAEGWHLYSQHVSNDIGPVPTSFQFEETENFKTIGKTVEPKPFKEYDENFGGELDYFKEEVTFKQKFKHDGEAEISGSVTYMICNSTMCMPPTDVEFKLKID